MFFVFNKSKIYSYMIALSTVTLLFVAAATLNDAISPTNTSIETGVNAIESNSINNENTIKNFITNE